MVSYGYDKLASSIFSSSGFKAEIIACLQLCIRHFHFATLQVELPEKEKLAAVSYLSDVPSIHCIAKETVSRATRVETNKDNIYNLLNAQQRDFASYELSNYVELGVDELDIAKLSVETRMRRNRKWSTLKIDSVL